jgi:hypothetical protein
LVDLDNRCHSLKLLLVLRALVSATLLGTLACLPPPRITTSRGIWREIRTEHFEVLTNVAGSDAVGVARTAEEMRSALIRAALSGRERAAPPARLVVLNDPTDMPYADGIWQVGLLGKRWILTSWQQRTDPGVLIHEIAHDLISTELGSAPRWLNEGLATYLMRVSVANGEYIFGAPEPRGDMWRPALEAKDVIDPASMRFDYRLASWIIYHLINREQGAFRHYLNLLARGKDEQESWAAAFPRYRGPEGLSLLNEAVRRTAEESADAKTFRASRVPAVHYSGPADDRLLTPAEVNALLAEVVASTDGDYDELSAEMARKAVTGGGPTRASAVLIALSPDLMVRLRIADEAMRTFPENRETNLLLDLALGDRIVDAATEKRRIETLEAALRANRDDGWVAERLARAYAREGDLDAAERSLSLARRLLPSNNLALETASRIAEARHDCKTALRFQRQATAQIVHREQLLKERKTVYGIHSDLVAMIERRRVLEKQCGDPAAGR